jgi:hypothetical protein
MFYSEEKDEKVIPLPGKKYEDMAPFFNVVKFNQLMNSQSKIRLLNLGRYIKVIMLMFK